MTYGGNKVIVSGIITVVGIPCVHYCPLTTNKVIVSGIITAVDIPCVHYCPLTTNKVIVSGIITVVDIPCVPATADVSDLIRIDKT